MQLVTQLETPAGGASTPINGPAARNSEPAMF